MHAQGARQLDSTTESEHGTILLRNVVGQGVEGCWRSVAGQDALDSSCFTEPATDTLAITVRMPAGGTYRLLYVNACPGPPNAFKSTVEPYSGTTFPTAVPENRTNSRGFPNSQRDFKLTFPNGTTGIRLTFLLEVSPGGVHAYLKLVHD